jgi:murein DD-endopeptidase MepM/ murein hydrolase activator NlpD
MTRHRAAVLLVPILALGPVAPAPAVASTVVTTAPAVQYAEPGTARWLTGRVTSDGAGVAYRPVQVDRADAARWVYLTSARTRSDGTFSARVAPRRTAAYRVRFPGVPGLAAAAGPAVTVRTVRYAFPVRGRNAYGHTHALYPATDVFAACGTRVVSTVDGVVLEANRVDRFDPAHPDGAWKGGRFVSIAGDDGVRHYGAHLRWIRRTVRPGVRVAAGRLVGTVGRTGNAGNVCHLHFALSPLCARTGDWWLRRGVVSPWRFLDRWRTGRWATPHGTVRGWQRAHGCPARP